MEIYSAQQRGSFEAFTLHFWHVIDFDQMGEIGACDRFSSFSCSEWTVCNRPIIRRFSLCRKG